VAQVAARQRWSRRVGAGCTRPRCAEAAAAAAVAAARRGERGKWGKDSIFSARSVRIRERAGQIGRRPTVEDGGTGLSGGRFKNQNG
jgi:hypothetical protein